MGSLRTVNGDIIEALGDVLGIVNVFPGSGVDRLLIDVGSGTGPVAFIRYVGDRDWLRLEWPEGFNGSSRKTIVAGADVLGELAQEAGDLSG